LVTIKVQCDEVDKTTSIFGGADNCPGLIEEDIGLDGVCVVAELCLLLCSI